MHVRLTQTVHATRRATTARPLHRAGRWLCATLLLAVSGAALALGTDAGREIATTAQADYSVAGVAQTPVLSNVAQTFVDELLDVVVVADDAGPVAVASPQTGAVVQFTVTNSGNGEEAFRLVADAAAGGDDFDPTLDQLFLESNAIPGLQTGAGGDTAYLAGSNDPVLAEDATVTVYVRVDVGGGLAQNDSAGLSLRAVAVTLFDAAGTDDPADAAFPAPGTEYAGQGADGSVSAVVGAGYDGAAPLLLASATLRVSGAVVAISKTVDAVVDPFGGATLIPGSILTYRIDVAVTGSASAEALVVSDAIPADLEYQPGTLTVTGVLPAGEDSDDDFAPVGSDNTGFDEASDTVTVSLGDQAGGATVSIQFQAAIR